MSAPFRVLAADSVSPRGLELLESTGLMTVDAHNGLKESELLPIIAEYDAIIVRSQTKITAKAIAAAPKLRVVGRAGVGYDNIDVEAASERGIVVMNTPGGNTISTAEHTFSLLLSLARYIPQAHASVIAGKWDRKSFQGVELCNKTLGIVGMGRIGGEVARRAIGFGMRVMAYDPYLAHSRARSLQVELVDSLTPLLVASDFITVHMPMTPETKGILNATTLAQCKPGVRLVNCARGGLIDEAALIDAVKSGHVAGVALDVFETEPPAADFGLRGLPNVVFTPHLGASTAEAQESVGIEVAEQIRDYLVDGVIRNAVNVPNVDVRALAVLRPYLSLGEKLGQLISQIAPHRIDTLTVNYTGKVRDFDTGPVTRAVLRGVLLQAVGPVNDVSAPRKAKGLGINYSETKLSEEGDFTELISVQVTAGDVKHEVAGTFFGTQPRIVRIDGHTLDANPNGILFIMENRDRPGIVGWIGTLLGKHNINIATMALSRTEPGSRALSVLNLDSAPGEEVIKEITADPDIYSVKVVKL
ncbi:MAG: phosphoglycerate dehydrogenase [Candidatus Methylacidiphilales bacterium]|nr:phosphoglycerate dehydrogenase [Candidatus Methylacidiphilales bacterium]